VAKLVNKIAWYFLAIGFLVPCLLQTVFYLGMFRVESMPDWLFLVLWPAFGFYMASDTGSGADTGRAAFGFLMSVVVNALIYGLMGALVAFFCQRVFQRRIVNP